jgi:hypothetical protein
MIFEVRMTAYERPELLRRALESLLAQTHTRWRATVMDDSRSAAISELVAAMDDDRIVYSRNPERLGAAANIDQCFAPEAREGGDYACLLEDDNYWLPDFLATMATILAGQPWDLVLANQRIYEEGTGLRPETETTRGAWFGSGAVDPLELRASLLLMEGLSNGGLVWRLGAGVDFRVGPCVRETGLHEACRSLLVDRPFLFVAEAHAVWTTMPKERTARSGESNRVVSRGMLAVHDAVLRLHGVELVMRAQHLAARMGRQGRLVEALAYSGRPGLAGAWLHGCRAAAWQAFLKGLAVRLIQPNPCFDFLRSARMANVRCGSRPSHEHNIHHCPHA